MTTIKRVDNGWLVTYPDDQGVTVTAVAQDQDDDDAESLARALATAFRSHHQTGLDGGIQIGYSETGWESPVPEQP